MKLSDALQGVTKVFLDTSQLSLSLHSLVFSHQLI
jgi:hypothetical protein